MTQFFIKHHSKLFWTSLVLAAINMLLMGLMWNWPNTQQIKELFFYNALLCAFGSYLNYRVGVFITAPPNRLPPE
jgi:hypothetical protein